MRGFCLRAQLADLEQLQAESLDLSQYAVQRRLIPNGTSQEGVAISCHGMHGELRSARESVVIAATGGLRMDGENLVRDASPAWMRKGVEASLDALGTDYIDLYQVHWPDQSVKRQAHWPNWSAMG